MFELASSMDVEGSLDIHTLVMHSDVYTFMGPITYSANITNTGEAFVVRGKALADAHVNCARCLDSFEYSFDCDFDAYILNPESPDFERVKNNVDLSENTEEIDASSNDDYIDSSFGLEDEYDVLPRTHKIDLVPHIESAFRLAAPAMPLCKPDCKGLCAQCGCNLNFESCTCSHDEDISQNPFSVLADYKFD